MICLACKQNPVGTYTGLGRVCPECFALLLEPLGDLSDITAEHMDRAIQEYLVKLHGIYCIACGKKFFSTSGDVICADCYNATMALSKDTHTPAPLEALYERRAPKGTP